MVVNQNLYTFETVKLNDLGEVVETFNKTVETFTETSVPSLSIKMVKIPAGSFLMGSTPQELEHQANESPQHEAKVNEFWMGMYCVTQAQWEAVSRLPKVQIELKVSPSWFKGDDLPVESVSWFEAQEFCQRLSVESGQPYRLPTEVEWEYCCRAGTTSPYSFGEVITKRYCNYDSDKTVPVYSYTANHFGLYCMHGNVWEWCQDLFDKTFTPCCVNEGPRVIRGGAWNDIPRDCRSAFRADAYPANRNSDFGFRVVCSAP